MGLIPANTWALSLYLGFDCVINQSGPSSQECASLICSLVYYVPTCCLLSNVVLPPSICRRRNCMHSLPELPDGRGSMGYPVVDCDEEAVSTGLFCHRVGYKRHGGSRSGSLDNRHHSTGRRDSSTTLSVFTYDSVHLGVKCYRALLNNQAGNLIS